MDPNDDEAPKDPGSTRQYTEKDFEGKFLVAEVRSQGNLKNRNLLNQFQVIGHTRFLLVCTFPEEVARGTDVTGITIKARAPHPAASTRTILICGQVSRTSACRKRERVKMRQPLIRSLN